MTSYHEGTQGAGRYDDRPATAIEQDRADDSGGLDMAGEQEKAGTQLIVRTDDSIARLGGRDPKSRARHATVGKLE